MHRAQFSVVTNLAVSIPHTVTRVTNRRIQTRLESRQRAPRYTDAYVMRRAVKNSLVTQSGNFGGC